MRLSRWLAVGLLTTFALVGCANGENLTAQQIMDRMKQTRENTRDAHVIGDVAMTGGQQDGSFTVEAWMKKSDKQDALGKPITQAHVVVLKASKPELQDTELVNDGTTVWIYSPSQKKVITGKLQDLQKGKVGAQDPTAQMMRMQEQLQQLLDGSDVVLAAENEPVAGMDAWKIKLTPKPETAQQMQLGSLVETNLWISHQGYMPLKALVNAGSMGKLEATVQKIELNSKKGIDPAKFTFTPPAGVEIVDAAKLAEKARPSTTNLDEARKSSSFRVLAPKQLPDGVKLEEVQKLSMGGEAVIQNYGGTVEFSLVQTKGERAFGENATPFGAKTTTVQVRGHEATLITGSTQERGTLLRFKENGVNIIIAGTLSPEQAEAIAESLQ